MSAFETASKLVVEEIGKKKLHHVPSKADSKSIKLLSVVEDGNIKEWSTADLPFEPETEVYTLCTLKSKFTKLNTKDGILGAVLKGVFGCDSTIGSKVSFNAEFEELACRKLKNVDSLIQYIESGEYSTSIGKKSSHSRGDWIRGIFRYILSWGNWILGIPSNTCSFKIIISVVYTTTPTEITRTYEHIMSGATATVDSTLSQPVEVECLPSGTLIAYGYLDVFVCANGSMKVKDKTVLRAKVQPSSSSAADASSTEKIKELEQKMDKMEQEKTEAQKEAKTYKEETAEKQKELEEKVNSLKQENRAIRQEKDQLEEIIDQLQEETAGEVKRNEDLQRQLTANKEMSDQQNNKIFQLEQELAEEVKRNKERNATLETNIKVMNEALGRVDRELRDEKKKYANDRKQFEAIFEELASLKDKQRNAATTNDGGDEDEEVPETES